MACMGYNWCMDNTTDLAADIADMHDSDGDAVSLQFVASFLRGDVMTHALEAHDLVYRPCGNVMPDGWVLVGRDDVAIDEHVGR